MKWVEISVLFCFFTMSGFYASSGLEKRIRKLKNLEKSLAFLNREIDYRKSPLGEALCRTAEKSKEPWKNFFMVVGEKLQNNSEEFCRPDEIFKEAVTRIKSYHPWEKDLHFLLNFGKIMGEADKNTQLVQLCMAKEELNGLIEEAEEEQKKKGKLYQTLGICLGMMGVILIL